MPLLMGIDLGTSSVKTALIDADSRKVVAVASQEYPVHHPKTGYAEQLPQEWWNATIKTVRQVHQSIPHAEISAIGLSGQMHGFVCIGRDAQIVRPAIIWADTRSSQQVQDLNQQIQSKPQDFLDICGLPSAGFMAVTLMWLARHEPETLGQTHKVILPKDYLRYQLTGTLGTDPSDAAATWLFDVKSSTWSDKLLQVCHIDPALMPSISPSSEVVGQLTQSAAEELGLYAGIPVVAGSADLPAQALGYGLIDAGQALVTVGTGGQVFVPQSQPQLDPEHRYYVFNHNVPDRWYAQAAILSAGLSLRWLRDTLGMRDSPDAFAYLSSLAADVPIGADGLLFLPYLAGERTPHMNPLASGMFLGLRLHHTPGHLARAVMEGVAFALKSCLDLIASSAQTVILSGGATHSPIWRQILADVLAVPLAVADSAPHASIGAALLAGTGAGLYPSIQAAITPLPAPTDLIEAKPGNVEFYQARYAQYQRLYPLLKDEMELLESV